MNASPGTWSTETIGEQTADVYEPPGGGAFESAVIYLHDLDLQTPANDDIFTHLFAEHSLPCVCPHGGRSWWLDRPCSEFHAPVPPMRYVREQVVSWIGENWNISPPAIGLLGVGMGGQGALQLAYRHARTFPVVAAISPKIDFHILHGQEGPLDEMFASSEAARQQTATLHLHPLNWPPQQRFVCDPADPIWYEGCQRLASKLFSIGIPFESDLESTSAGDQTAYLRNMVPRCVSFVAEGLREIGPR